MKNHYRLLVGAALLLMIFAAHRLLRSGRTVDPGSEVENPAGPSAGLETGLTGLPEFLQSANFLQSFRKKFL